MRFCSQCGKQISDDARFCPFCGTPTGLQAQPNPPQVSAGHMIRIVYQGQLQEKTAEEFAATMTGNLLSAYPQFSDKMGAFEKELVQILIRNYQGPSSPFTEEQLQIYTQQAVVAAQLPFTNKHRIRILQENGQILDSYAEDVVGTCMSPLQKNIPADVWAACKSEIESRITQALIEMSASTVGNNPPVPIQNVTNTVVSIATQVINSHQPQRPQSQPSAQPVGHRIRYWDGGLLQESTVEALAASAVNEIKSHVPQEQWEGKIETFEAALTRAYMSLSPRTSHQPLTVPQRALFISEAAKLAGIPWSK